MSSAIAKRFGPETRVRHAETGAVGVVVAAPPLAPRLRLVKWDPPEGETPVREYVPIRWLEEES